jgi:hypothetical protein
MKALSYVAHAFAPKEASRIDKAHVIYSLNNVTTYIAVFLVPSGLVGHEHKE